MHLRYLLILLFLTAPEVFAGTWTSYTSHNDVRAIAFEGNYVWCGTTGGVTRWDKRDGSRRWYSTTDGLISNNVRAVAVDKTGRKWFGAAAGVSIYNGSDWKTYTSANGLVDDDVNVIEVGPDGKVWVGSKTGMSMFDGREWTRWNRENVPSYAEGKFTDLSSIAFGKNGTVWCSAGYSDGSQVLWEFDGVSWDKGGSKAKTVRTDSTGKLWNTYYVGFTVDDLVTHSGDSTMYHETPGYDGTARLYPDFAIDRNDVLWLIRNHEPGLGMERDLVRYDGSTWSAFTPVVGNNGTVLTEWMHVVRVDDEGIVWIGSEQGLLRFDGVKWKRFLDGLAQNDTSSGVIDRDGALWFSSRGVVSRFDGSQWESYGGDSDFLADYSVGSIVVDDWNVKWFGAQKGIVRFDGSTWSTLPYPEGPSNENYSLLAVDHAGTIWCTYEKDRLACAASFDGQQWTFYSSENLLSTSWTFLAIDRDNRKWFCTNQGLSCFDGHSWTTHRFPRENFSTGPANAGYCDSEGNLWFGVESSLFCFDGQTWREFERLSSESVRSIARDRNGVIWLGSLSGVERFDGKEWQLLTVADGLLNNTANIVLVDARNTKWFSTWGGISAYADDMSGIGERFHPSMVSLSTFPNPFNPSVTIEFTLPESGPASLEIYSLSGQRIRTLFSGKMNVGGHALVWDGREEHGRTVSSGVYFARITAGACSTVKKMLLLR